jgi:hypothetical protein
METIMSGGISQTRDIAELVSVRQDVAPQSFSGSAAVSGSDIDRRALNDPQSCVMHLGAGAVTGTPTSFSLTPKLQHADDSAGSAGTYADYQTGSAVTTSGGETSTAIDLSGAKEWVRMVVTPSFSGGTSPTAMAAGDLVFGGGQLG